MITDRDATAACSDDNNVFLDQINNDRTFNDFLGNWTCDNATIATPSIFFHYHAFLLKLQSLYFCIKHANWFGGMIERRIMPVNNNTRNESNNFFADTPMLKSRKQFLFNKITQLTLNFGINNIKRLMCYLLRHACLWA